MTYRVAGVATTPALAGAEFGRPEPTAAARGAEHLVSLGTTDGESMDNWWATA